MKIDVKNKKSYPIRLLYLYHFNFFLRSKLYFFLYILSINLYRKLFNNVTY